MPNEKTPQLILRMGSHSEREYIIKTVQLFNGVMLAANLVEATPGASASLVVKLCGRSKLGFYLDPMTYAYGAYVDPATGSEREDLDWIKSEQRRKGKLVRDFKSSYRKLAERLGAPFDSAIERNSAVTPEDFKDDAVLAQACESVADYQVQRIRRELDDPEYAEFRQDLPTPAVVFTRPRSRAPPGSGVTRCAR